jgi:hypothetical protein
MSSPWVKPRCPEVNDDFNVQCDRDEGHHGAHCHRQFGKDWSSTKSYGWETERKNHATTDATPEEG